jgi:hypothetical protein
MATDIPCPIVIVGFEKRNRRDAAKILDTT